MPTIIEMVNHTRLDCVIGAATGYRAGVVQALNHAAHRSAFGKELIDQPLMQNVLADLASSPRPPPSPRCAWPAPTTRSPPATTRPPSSGASPTRSSSTGSASAPPPTRSSAWSASAATATSRSRACPASIARPRSPRSGRARATSSASTSCAPWSRTQPRSTPSSPRSCEGAGAEPKLDAYVSSLRDEIPGDIETIESRARRIVEKMAVALQASLLVRYGDPAVADAFCASRLSGDWGHAFGTLPAGTDFSASSSGTARGPEPPGVPSQAASREFLRRNPRRLTTAGRAAPGPPARS